MAQNNAQTLTEDDGPGDDEDVGAPKQTDRLRPLAPMPLRLDSESESDDEEFEVIATDDNNKPVQSIIVGEDRKGTKRQAREDANLSEDESGQDTYLESQDRGGDGHVSRSTQRKRVQKEAARRVHNENRQLKNELNGLRGEVEQLRAKFGAVEPRVLELGEARIKDQSAQLDARIAEAAKEVDDAYQEIADSFDSGDKAAMVAAHRRRDEALIKKTKLENTKAAMGEALARRQAPSGDEDQDGGRQSQQKSQQDQPRRVAAPAPAVQKFITEFSDEFDWFDPRQNSRGDVVDRDSRRVLMLDDEITKEGFDPTTQEYWDELRERMRSVVPDRFKDANSQKGGRNDDDAGDRSQRGTKQNVPPARRGPMTAAPSDRSSSGRAPTQVVLSRARRDALTEANILAPDGSILNKPKFQRVLKQYAEHDRANGAGRT